MVRIKILSERNGIRLHMLRFVISHLDRENDPENKELLEKIPECKPIYKRWIQLVEYNYNKETQNMWIDEMQLDQDDISEIALIAGII